MNNICYICDKTFFIPTLASINSLLRASDKDVVIHLITTFPVTYDEKTIIDYLRIKHQEFDLKKISYIKAKNHVSLAAYVKILLPNLFSNIDKLLFLDGDTLILQNISQIFSYNIDNKYLAAVFNKNYIIDNHIIGSCRHFNSGLMYLNLQKMRNDDIPTKMLNFVEQKNHLTFLNDQAAFNAIIKDNYLELSPIFNAMIQFWWGGTKVNGFPKSIIKQVRKNPVVIHFNGKIKPWMTGCAHPYKKIFRESLSEVSEEYGLIKKGGINNYFIEYLRFVRGAFLLYGNW